MAINTLVRSGAFSGNEDSNLAFTFTTDATAAAAQNIYCGFIPKKITVVNITDGFTDMFYPGIAAAKSEHIVWSTGVHTLNATNGFTLLDGTEAVPAATLIAVGTNGSSGQGFTIGTFILVASKSYGLFIQR